MSKYPKVVMVAIEPYLTMNSLSNKWDEFHWNCINTKSTINIKNNIKDLEQNVYLITIILPIM